MTTRAGGFMEAVGSRAPEIVMRLVARLPTALALPSAARAEDPANFDRELAHLRRLVACDTRAGDGVTPPEGMTLKQVDGSCKKVKAQVERFRKRWLDK